MHFSFKKTALALSLVGIGAVAGGSAVSAYQGHMWSAMSDLRAASNQLGYAMHDKHGHRMAAMNLVNQAIYQVQLGIHDGAM